MGQCTKFYWLSTSHTIRCRRTQGQNHPLFGKIWTWVQIQSCWTRLWRSIRNERETLWSGSQNKDWRKTCSYVHFNAHCLNLVLIDTVKAVPEADCFFALLQKLYVYMFGSYVHQKWLDVPNETYESQPRELQMLSDTRWACRYLACSNLMDRLHAVLRVLHDIAWHSFRRTIFYPIVDTILGELDRRFSKDNCEIMRGIQAKVTLKISGMNSTRQGGFCKGTYIT